MIPGVNSRAAGMTATKLFMLTAAQQPVLGFMISEHGSQGGVALLHTLWCSQQHHMILMHMMKLHDVCTCAYTLRLSARHRLDSVNNIMVSCMPLFVATFTRQEPGIDYSHCFGFCRVSCPLMWMPLFKMCCTQATLHRCCCSLACLQHMGYTRQESCQARNSYDGKAAQ